MVYGSEPVATATGAVAVEHLVRAAQAAKPESVYQNPSANLDGKKNSFPLALLFVNIPIILLSRREAMSRSHDYLKAAAICGNAAALLLSCSRFAQAETVPDRDRAPAARHPPFVVGVFHFVVFSLATVE